MARLGKYLSSILVLILSVSILSTIVSSCAQTTPEFTPYPEIPKPSVPQFSVKLLDSSYDIPASSSIDPYTGQTVTHPSQHIEARTIEIRIKTEAITPFEVKLGVSNWTAALGFDIRWRGHFEKDWRNLESNGFLSNDSGILETVVTVQGEYSSTEGLKMDSQGMYSTLPPDSQLDFQVRAKIGFLHRVVDPTPGGGWIFTGETSDWSNTQTLNLADPSPSVPEFPILSVLPLFVVVPLVAYFAVKEKCTGQVTTR